jgi:hypothetical protein
VLHNLELQDPCMRKLIWRILNELPACATHGYGTMRWRLTHHDLPPVDCRPFSSVRVPPQSWHLNSAPHLDKASSVGLRGALQHTHELGSCGCRQGCFAFVLQSVPSMRFLPIIDDPIRVSSCMQNMCFILIYKLCLAFTGTRWFCSLADEQNILYTFFAEQQRSKSMRI